MLPIALFRIVCYNRAVPGSDFAPMLSDCNFFLTAPIALFEIMCYNNTTIKYSGSL